MIIRRRAWRGFGDAEYAGPCRVTGMDANGSLRFDGACSDIDAVRAAIAQYGESGYDEAMRRQIADRIAAMSASCRDRGGGVFADDAGNPCVPMRTPPPPEGGFVGPPAPLADCTCDEDGDCLDEEGRPCVPLPAAPPPAAPKPGRAWLWWTVGTVAVGGIGAAVWWRSRRTS